MHILRALLVWWLCLAVPATALAALVDAAHCQHSKPATLSSPLQHEMHANMQMAEHALHQSSELNPEDASTADCKCDGNCASSHCVTSGSGLIGASSLVAEIPVEPGQQLALFVPARPLAAHHRAILRPPSLS